MRITDEINRISRLDHFVLYKWQTGIPYSSLIYGNIDALRKSISVMRTLLDHGLVVFNYENQTSY